MTSPYPPALERARARHAMRVLAGGREPRRRRFTAAGRTNPTRSRLHNRPRRCPMSEHPRRGDVFLAFLDPVIGCEQGGTRPVLIVQNDAGNKRSRTVIVAAITSKPKRGLPTHVPVPAVAGLREESVVLLEQLKTIDKARLRAYVGHMGQSQMEKVDSALAVSLGIKGGQGRLHAADALSKVPSNVLRFRRLPGVPFRLPAGRARTLHHLQYKNGLRLQGSQQASAIKPHLPSVRLADSHRSKR